MGKARVQITLTLAFLLFLTGTAVVEADNPNYCNIRIICRVEGSACDNQPCPHVQGWFYEAGACRGPCVDGGCNNNWLGGTD